MNIDNTDDVKILSIGNVSVDIKAFTAEEDENEAYRDGTIDLVPGGVGRGMAINLKHLGFETAILGFIGQDIFGDFLKKGFIAEGVNTELLQVSGKYHTALFSVMATTGNPASCVYNTNIVKEIRLSDEVRNFLDEKKATAICMDSNLTPEALAQFYAYKKAHEDLYVFQNATSPDIARKSIEYASLVDCFACNQMEASAVLGEAAFPDPECARKFASLGFRHFIITFGESGVMVYKDGEVWNEKPFVTPDIIDTIGAGDAFASGYLYGVFKKRPVKDCIRYGLISAKETLLTRQTVSEKLCPSLFENY